MFHNFYTTIFKNQQPPSLKAQFREPVHILLFGTAPSGGAMFCKNIRLLFVIKQKGCKKTGYPYLIFLNHHIKLNMPFGFGLEKMGNYVSEGTKDGTADAFRI
ncbi:hypothetical protein CXF72_08540 [Psychromonas sp. MB-3u-54]|uniref:hypothetical protein n=1 Tax=Psychromonas sp. MB-3u-54 TaxID=2058319 RepID=UPI000C32998A|nr:hypothetical protein [Psychromonas sp. MB-3u-54]PKH03046.1 hypothetical protein CXF72_08540 [Psychromonas sp. MB-3u-54]